MTQETQHSPYDILDRCIHCGMCLQSCPTYALTGFELSSPRGRIRLMRSVAEDKLPITRTFVDEMYFCLDCQACETVCPAGVRYGALVENARHLIAEARRDPFAVKMLKKLFLNGILVSRKRLGFLSKVLRLYAGSGLRDAVERSGILSLFSSTLEDRHRLLPSVDGRAFHESVQEILPPFNRKSKGRVAFLTGCIMDYVLPNVHQDCVEVLRACGFEVVIPKTQVCCGSLHGHNGELEMAKMLARKNLDVFEHFAFDYVTVDSAGCSAFLKEYGSLLATDRFYMERARVFSSRVNDITEFLANVDLPPLRPLRRTVTYHEACHLVHSQQISAQPRKLIQSIPGVEFVELPEATWCCGSAGVYNVVRFRDSMKLLERKINNLVSTGVDCVATANPGCHLQMQYGTRKFGLKIDVVHPVQLVRKALELGKF